MRTDRVVVNPPTFRQNLRFLECVEQLAVEKLRPHFPIERFDVAIFPGRARLDIEGLDLEHLQPAPQLPGDELGPGDRPPHGCTRSHATNTLLLLDGTRVNHTLVKDG
jgi:hypothetical protein